MNTSSDQELRQDLSQLLDSEHRDYLYQRPRNWVRDRDNIIDRTLRDVANESQEELRKRRARTRALASLWDLETAYIRENLKGAVEHERLANGNIAGARDEPHRRSKQSSHGVLRESIHRLVDALLLSLPLARRSVRRERAVGTVKFVITLSESDEPSAKAWAYRLADESLQCVSRLPHDQRQLVMEYFLTDGSQLPKSQESWLTKPQRYAEFMAAARALQQAMLPVVESIDQARGRTVDVNDVDSLPDSGTVLLNSGSAESTARRQ